MKDQLGDNTGKPDSHISMDSDRIHPKVLRELANVIAKPFSINFKGH